MNITNTKTRGSRIIERALSPGIRRMVLPMGSGIVIPPNTSAKITARPQDSAIWPDRLLIKHAERWRINEAEIARIPWLPRGSGAAFAASEYAMLPEREVSIGGDITFDVTYVGDDPRGESLEGCLFGYDGPGATGSATKSTRATPQEDDVRVQARTTRPTRSGVGAVDIFVSSLPPHTSFWPRRLIIDDARRWAVNDIKINGISVLVQSGNLPGDMFSGAPALLPFRLGLLSNEDEFEVTATYLGSGNPVAFAYELSGSTAPEPSAGVSAFLPMSSSCIINMNTSAQISSRLCIPGDFQRSLDFQAEQIVVADPEDWVINDIKVGNASQFSQSGDIPGIAFAATSVGTSLDLHRLAPGIDLVILVTYVGASEYGAPFICGISGNAVRRRSDSH